MKNGDLALVAIFAGIVEKPESAQFQVFEFNNGALYLAREPGFNNDPTSFVTAFERKARLQNARRSRTPIREG